MKRFLLFALATVPLWVAGQQPATLKPLPEYTYITPDMSKKQIDSLIAALGPYDLSLSFDTLEYENNAIKKISGALYAKDEYFLVSSANFKGMTIISRGQRAYIVMGLFYPKKQE